MCETSIYLSCILEGLESVYFEISINPNDQRRLCTFVFFNSSKSKDHRVKFWFETFRKLNLKW